MSTETVAQRSIVALRWAGIGAAGRLAAQLVIQVALARILGPDAFGEFALILVVIGLGFLLADLGLGAALIQKRELTEDDIALALGWSTVAALTLAGLLVLMAPVVARLLGAEQLAPMCALAACLIVLMTWRNISSSLLRRDLNYRSPQLVDLFAYLFMFGGVALVLALQGFGAWSLLIGMSCQTLFSLVATYTLCRHPLRPRLRGDAGLLRFALTALGNDLMGWISANLDRVVISRNWGLQPLGFYAVAASLVRGPTALALEAAQGLMFACTARVQQDVSALQRGFLLAISALALATLPAMLLLATEAQAVISLVYGPSWLPAAPAVAALACAVPLVGTSVLSASVLRGTGAVGTEFVIQAAGCALLIGGLFALRAWPIEQAVWWIVFASALRALSLLGAVLRKLQLRPIDLVRGVKGALWLSACACASAYTVHWLGAGALPDTALLPLLAGMSVFAILLACRPRYFLGQAVADLLRATLVGGWAAGWIGKRLAP